MDAKLEACCCYRKLRVVFYCIASFQEINPFLVTKELSFNQSLAWEYLEGTLPCWLVYNFMHIFFPTVYSFSFASLTVQTDKLSTHTQDKVTTSFCLSPLSLTHALKVTEVNFCWTHKYPGTDVPNLTHLSSPNSCSLCDMRYVALALASRGLV